MKTIYFLSAFFGMLFIFSCQDLDTISYQTDIEPLFTTCANAYCHGGASGEVNFGDYESTSNTITGGRVLGALRQEEGFKAMPFGNEVEGKWSSENIQLLEEWIDAGMPK